MDKQPTTEITPAEKEALTPMFPTETNGSALYHRAIRYAVKNAVAMPFGRFFKGQIWSFWMEDDPRIENGILKLATYQCHHPGDYEESRWIKIDLP